MANHIRKQLRDALAGASVLGNLTTTSTRVHGFLVDPLEVSATPALSIHIPSEDVEDVTVHTPAQQERDIEVHVMGIAGTVGNPDDTLDQIAKEVETALASAITVGSKSVQLRYRGCEITRLRGEKTAGQIDLRFIAKAFTVANVPDVFT